MIVLAGVMLYEINDNSVIINQAIAHISPLACIVYLL